MDRMLPVGLSRPAVDSLTLIPPEIIQTFLQLNSVSAGWEGSERRAPLIKAILLQESEAAKRQRTLWMPPISSSTSPRLLTVQTLSRGFLRTRAAPPVGVLTPRRRSLNHHSCAGGSPLVLGCCDACCADCRYGNGGDRGGEIGGSDLGWYSERSAKSADGSWKSLATRRTL